MIVIARTDSGVAAMGRLASFAALTSSAPCCVLPLVLATMGLSAGGLSWVVPYRWPLTIAAALLLGAGWLLYLRRRRPCAADADCPVARSGRGTLLLLSVASALTVVSASWKSFEQPLIRALGG